MSSSDSRWRAEETALDGAFTDPVFFPRRINNVTVRVDPGAGSSTVYFTLDDFKSVQTDPDSANWDAWEPGSVSVATSRALAGPVTAVRASATGALVRLQVVGAVDY
jgi:hypothetical protein